MNFAAVQSRFPRSAGYDLNWAAENQMGPNALWLTETLSEKMDLHPGMRVLDLGCGKALSSIFLAREFGVQVWAADLWIKPTENWRRIEAAGLGQQVFPIAAEAHQLPFAEGFFDAMISMDAYHYFGTCDIYLGWHLLKLLRPGAQLGIIVPGLRTELESVPEHLKPYWDWEFWTFHSPAWWTHHWKKLDLLAEVQAGFQDDGWEHWLAWQEKRRDLQLPDDESETQMLREDGGRCLGFTWLTGRRKK